MNKKNKILIIVLLIVLMMIVCFVGYRFLDNKQGNADNDSKDTITEVSEITKTGTIVSMDDKHVIVNKMQFDISSSDEIFYVDDEVSITFSAKDRDKEWIPILTIQLIKRDEQKLKVNSTLENMTIEEKVGQMFMVRCPVDNGVEIVDQYQVGGYILFDANILPYTRDEFIANNNAYQAHAKIPMFIGVDEEGGDVNRLSWYWDYRAAPFASPQTLFAQGGFDLIRSDTKEKADLLKSVGVNVNFAPVADVSTDPNDFIYSRVFGVSAEQTAEYVKVVVGEMKNNQLGSVLKHFPGYGNNANTHTGSSYDQRPLSQFESQDFLPFIAGIETGADSILVNHNVITNMDDSSPASLSKIVHEILRDELNFDGVIFTDDLIMQAITNQYGDETSAVMAVNAGNDMLISSNFVVQYDAVLRAVQNGEISEERLNESVKRILVWKYNLGILN